MRGLLETLSNPVIPDFLPVESLKFLLKKLCMLQLQNHYGKHTCAIQSRIPKITYKLP
jgi:hypothetical protein